MDIEKWLNDLGLGEYAKDFIKNAIDDDSLFDLTDDDLKALSITKLGHRKKILKAISAGTSIQYYKKEITPKSTITLPSKIKVNKSLNEITSPWDVFISYSTNDAAVAKTVLSTFENEGIKCWFAPRELRAKGGAPYAESLIEALYSVRAMVLVFSASSNDSAWVQREVDRAVARGLHIAPLRIENTEPTKAMEFYLATPQWIDAYTPPLNEHVNLLTQTMKAFLVEKGESERPTANIDRLKKVYEKAGSRNESYAAFWLGSRFASGLKFYQDFLKTSNDRAGLGHQFLTKEFEKYESVVELRQPVEQIYKNMISAGSAVKENTVKQSALADVVNQISKNHGSGIASWFVVGMSISSLYSQGIHSVRRVPQYEVLEECKRCFDSIVEIGSHENLKPSLLKKIRQMSSNLEQPERDTNNLQNLIKELAVTIETYLLTGEYDFDPDIVQPIIEQNSMFAMYALKWFLDHHPEHKRAMALLVKACATEVYSDDIKLDTLFPVDKIELLAWSLEETIRLEVGSKKADNAVSMLQKIESFRAPVEQREKTTQQGQARKIQKQRSVKIGNILWKPSLNENELKRWHKISFQNVSWSFKNGICKGDGLGFLLSQKEFQNDFKFDVQMRIMEKMHELADGGIVFNSNPEKSKFCGTFFSIRMDQQVLGETIKTKTEKSTLFVIPFSVRLKEWLKLSLIVQGEQYQFFINGKLFHSGDNNFLQKGSLGLRVVHADVEFRDIVIYSLDTEMETIKNTSNDSTKEKLMGFFTNLFSGKKKKKSAGADGSIIGTVKKNVVEKMVNAGGAPPAVQGVPEDHLTALLMHYYHPLMQQGDNAGAQKALSNAIVNYNLGLISVGIKGNEYRIMKD